MRAEIPTFKQKYSDVEDLSLKWDLTKMEIRGFTITYSKNKAKKRKSAEIYFQNQINELYKKAEKHPNNKQIINKIYYTRSRLKNIMQHETKGRILRSKVRWYEHGERNTRYFYGLQMAVYLRPILNLTGRNALIKFFIHQISTDLQF